MTMKAPILLSTLAIMISTLAFATGIPGVGPHARAHIRTDRVKADLATLASEDDERSYTREIYLGEEGVYKVVVKSNIGVVRLTGQYLDKELTIEHGEFTYFFPNGRMQARGRFDHGVKAGTWERKGMSGAQLSVREYTGNDLEAMQEDAGIISFARTLEQEAAATTTTDDTRRWSVAMEF